MDRTSRSPRLLDRLRSQLRVRRRSLSTERSYVGWVKRFIYFHGVRHPQEMGREEIEAFLNHLAVDLGVAASTQNQALNALVFLYRYVLKSEVGELQGLGDRTYKLGSGTTSEYGRYVKSLGGVRRGRGKRGLKFLSASTFGSGRFAFPGTATHWMVRCSGWSGGVPRVVTREWEYGAPHRVRPISSP